MVEIRRVVACAECVLYWDGNSEPAKCHNDNHSHHVFERHRHLDLLVLPDGTRLTAASFDPAAPYVRDHEPAHGLYLDPCWQPPWHHDHVDWADFGLPASTDAAVDALKALLERARSGQDVEVGCIGGHGRTGTALACLAVLAGHPGPDAVAWIRSSYCPKAVEAPAQEAFVATFLNC